MNRFGNTDELAVAVPKICVRGVTVSGGGGCSCFTVTHLECLFTSASSRGSVFAHSFVMV